MSRLPETLRIFGKRYAIQRVVDPFKQGQYGECDDQACTIRIATDAHPDQELDTLVHELIHAVDFAMRLNLSERQVHALGAGLSGVLCDNPKLVRYIGRETKRR